MEHQDSYTNWLGQHLFTCPFKAHFGFDCPGCGFQRAVIALLKGDMITSFKFYPAALPIILLFVFTLLHLKLDFKIGAATIRVAFMGIAIIIFINYIYKIYSHQLFS